MWCSEEIAAAFNLSPKTVSNYHYAIKSKLGVSSDVELVLFGLRSSLITLVEERKHQTISDGPNNSRVKS